MQRYLCSQTKIIYFIDKLLALRRLEPISNVSDDWLLTEDVICVGLAKCKRNVLPLV